MYTGGGSFGGWALDKAVFTFEEGVSKLTKEKSLEEGVLEEEVCTLIC